MIVVGTPNKGNITIISLCVGHCVLHQKSWKEDYSQQKAYSFNIILHYKTLYLQEHKLYKMHLTLSSKWMTRTNDS